jgi:hypothetical protein
MPEPPEKYTVDSEAECKASPLAGTNTGEDQDFSAYSTIQPHLITQAELNDLAPDFDLPKTKARLVGSWLQQWNLPEKGVKVSFYRKDRTLQITSRWKVIWYTATMSVG